MIDVKNSIVKEAVLSDVSFMLYNPVYSILASVPVGTFDRLTAAGDLRAQVRRGGLKGLTLMLHVHVYVHVPAAS
jgi:hypothetical protein